MWRGDRQSGVHGQLLGHAVGQSKKVLRYSDYRLNENDPWSKASMNSSPVRLGRHATWWGCFAAHADKYILDIISEHL
jgi:hypothetical protein